MESERSIPLPKMSVTRHTTNVAEPTIQLRALPKSAAPCPPAKLLAPMGRSERPMAATTVAATICGMSFVHLLGKRPRQPSTTPPMMTAPISVPMPWVEAMTMERERNVNEMPITMGSREPMRHTG